MFEDVKFSSCGKFVSSDDWIHPDRVIDSYEMILVTKGYVYLNEGGTDYELKENDVLILEPHKRHYGYKHSRNTEFFWLHWHGNAPEGLKHRKIDSLYTVSLYFRQILQHLIEPGMREATDYLTRLILIELQSNSTNPTNNHIVEEIAAYIRANSHMGLTEAKVAKHIGYNTDYLNRIFKAHYFKTIKQYINERRMETVKSLMLTQSYTLSEIAAKSGFTEYKYFLKFFKYHEGITPTEFYKQYAKIHINSR